MGNHTIFVKAYGAPGHQQLPYLTGCGKEIMLNAWTFSQRHRVERKSAMGTNGHTVTAVNTGFLTILHKGWESVFISQNDNLRWTLLRAHAVMFTFLLVNSKKAHIHSLCGIIFLGLKFSLPIITAGAVASPCCYLWKKLFPA
jgi:hypothetical protein